MTILLIKTKTTIPSQCQLPNYMLNLRRSCFVITHAIPRIIRTNCMKVKTLRVIRLQTLNFAFSRRIHYEGGLCNNRCASQYPTLVSNSIGTMAFRSCARLLAIIKHRINRLSSIYFAGTRRSLARYAEMAIFRRQHRTFMRFERFSPLFSGCGWHFGFHKDTGHYS